MADNRRTLGSTHRRDLLLAVAAIVAAGRGVGGAQGTPAPGADATASVRFVASDADVRTLAVSVSRWETAENAAAYRESLLTGARSDLPAGEFYQTDPVDVAVPANLLAAPAEARAWQTIVGVAGFTTEWLLLIVGRDRLVWDIRLSGAEGVSLVEPAAAVAAALITRDPTGDLATLVPGSDDVPAGMRRED